MTKLILIYIASAIAGLYITYMVIKLAIFHALSDFFDTKKEMEEKLNAKNFQDGNKLSAEMEERVSKV